MIIFEDVPSDFENVPLVDFMYLVLTPLPGGVTVGDWGLSCCVPCLLSAVNSLRLLLCHCQEIWLTAERFHTSRAFPRRHQSIVIFFFLSFAATQRVRHLLLSNSNTVQAQWSVVDFPEIPFWTELNWTEACIYWDPILSSVGCFFFWCVWFLFFTVYTVLLYVHAYFRARFSPLL